jgi:hypothetical protein
LFGWSESLMAGVHSHWLAGLGFLPGKPAGEQWEIGTGFRDGI